MTSWKLLFAASALALADAAHAVITITPLGTAAPPTTFVPPGSAESIPLIPAIDDTSPVFADVVSAPLSPSKNVLFSIPLSHRQIGSGWGSWSHGYIGDVYYTNSASELSLSFDQADLHAFYFYVEPNFFGLHDMTITAWSVDCLSQSITVSVEGFSGAQGFLAVTDGASNVAGLSITMIDGTDFAVGEFGWSKQTSPPAPGPPWLLGQQKVSEKQGGFTGDLDDEDHFGGAAANIGDLDGDDVADLAVGAIGDDDGGPCRGAVWVLSLNTDGTVEGHQKISDTEGGFTGVLEDGDWFGSSIARLADLDGDGITEMAVGARHDDDGGLNRGAVWILFLNADGTIKSHQKISDTEGGFTGELEDGDEFGVALADLGDLDGDGIFDLAIGSYGDDGRGAVWILFLNIDGTVKSHQKISDTEGGFTSVLDDSDFFGSSLTRLDDLNNDGIVDLVAGAWGDTDGGTFPWLRGAVWVLFLNRDGTVSNHQKISQTQGGFTGDLDSNDHFGKSVAGLGDLDGDGFTDLAVGAPGDDDGVEPYPESSATPFLYCGAVWVLFLNSDGTVKVHQKISMLQGGFAASLEADDSFGGSVAALGDVNGDGIMDLAAGASGDEDGGIGYEDHFGAVWMLFLDDEPVPPPDPADFNGDGEVNVIDLDQLLEVWGRCPAATPCCPADLDGSGIVNGLDLAMLLAAWG